MSTFLDIYFERDLIDGVLSETEAQEIIDDFVIKLRIVRANLAKCLLYAINGGRDELTGKQVGPVFGAVEGEYFNFDDVLQKFEKMMDWLARVYVNAMNVIHYMHDRYAYERIEMALHDCAPFRTMAFGIAGLSVVADGLSAIRYAKVRVIRDSAGLVTDYQIEGEFLKFGNNDNRVDQIASGLVSRFMNMLRKYPTYRNALHTQSVLTITSNVVYGKATGNTPTAADTESHSSQARIQCMVGIAAGFMLRLRPSPRFRIATLRTAFHLHRP